MTVQLNTSPAKVSICFLQSHALADPVLAVQAQALLDAHEQEILQRLRAPEAQRDYLAAHALARTMLGELCHTHPARLEFRPTAAGRPELVTPTSRERWRFSLSHAAGMALCAVTNSAAIGADIESERNLGSDPLTLARTICTPAEMQALLLPPAEALNRRLTALWTTKEALAKALGQGFQLPLHRLAIIDGSTATPPPSTHRCWRIVSLRLSAHHIATIALPPQTAPPALWFEEVRPLTPQHAASPIPPLQFAHDHTCVAGPGRCVQWP